MVADDTRGIAARVLYIHQGVVDNVSFSLRYDYAYVRVARQERHLLMSQMSVELISLR